MRLDGGGRRTVVRFGDRSGWSTWAGCRLCGLVGIRVRVFFVVVFCGEEVGDEVGGLPFRLVDDGGVDVGGDGDGGVAEHRGDGFEVDSGGAGQRCRAVPEVVETYRGQAGLLGQGLEAGEELGRG